MEERQLQLNDSWTMVIEDALSMHHVLDSLVAGNSLQNALESILATRADEIARAVEARYASEYDASNASFTIRFRPASDFTEVDSESKSIRFGVVVDLNVKFSESDFERYDPSKHRGFQLDDIDIIEEEVFEAIDYGFMNSGSDVYVPECY